MIDWKVTVGGELPVGWDTGRDGCWFPDFETQALLLPHFNVADQPIDEYGKTVFDTAAVARLGAHLAAYRCAIEAQPESWTVTERSSRGETTVVVDRDAVLGLVDKTLNMVELALAQGGELVFFGD